MSDDSLDTPEETTRSEADHIDNNDLVANDTDSEEGSSNNPWETPRQEPVNGIVQPRVIAPIGKPTRHTNQLDFLLNTVMKEAMKHKHSWPFHSPVDAVKLNIPEYHKVVKKPMDLKTIEKRLRNVYYCDSKEAVKDFMQMFNNCYTFNPSHYGVYAMAKGLEEFLLKRLVDMPKKEEEIAPPAPKRGPKGRGGGRVSGNRGQFSRGGARKLPHLENDGALTPEDQHVIDHFHRATRAVSFPPDEEDATKDGTNLTTINESPSRESSVLSTQNKDIDETMPSVNSVDGVEPSTSSTFDSNCHSDKKIPGKGIKRKVEDISVEEPGNKLANRRESSRPIKKPNLYIDYSTVQPRLKGKLTEALKYCLKIVQELLGKRYKSFAWPFYEPVDVEALNLTDYYDIVKEPMDLGTVKKKLEHKMYINSHEVAYDIRLICSNCTTYNPAGSAIHKHGLELLRVFEYKFKDCPMDDDGNEHTSANSSTLSIQTDLSEDDKINQFINVIKAEQKKQAERLDMLRNLGEALYDIAMQRRDAKLIGGVGPGLSSAHYQQLEKLGLPISNDVTPKQEIISPSPSVRSSGRAPVPKIFDDVKAELLTPKSGRKTGRPAVAPQVPPEPRPYSGRGRRPGSKNKPKNLPPPKEYEFDSDDENAHIPLTYDEKMVLSQTISSFSVERVKQVIKIIEIREARMACRSPITNVEELEVDFEKLSTVTLRELQTFVKSVQAKERKPKKLMPIKNPIEAAKKRRELEAELDSLNEPKPKFDVTGVNSEVSGERLVHIPISNAKTYDRPDTTNDSSSDSSSSDDDSSSSSSSSSDSDSESELTPARRPYEQSTSNGKINKPNTSIAAPVQNSVSQLQPVPSAAATQATEVARKASLPQTSKKIENKSTNPVAKSGGVGFTILDTLLPETPAKKSPREEEKCLRMKMEEEERRKAMEAKRREEQKTKAVEDEEAELERIRRLQEEARRRREAEDTICVTDQMEMMANFEASF